MGSTLVEKWDFQQICPEPGVWIMVGQYLTNSTDLLNFSNSSPFIKCCLLRKKFPLLMITETFEHVVPYLSPKDIRSCRQVCCYWDKMCVSYLDSFYASTNAFFEKDVRYSVQNTVLIKNVADFRRWDDTMDLEQTNPVVCRSLNLVPEIPFKFLNEFMGRSITHLSAWGYHIWNLKLTYFDPIGDEDVSAIVNLTFLQACLHHLPNLKTISVNLENFRRQIIPIEGLQWLEANPFPAHASLRHFNSDSNCKNFSCWEGLATAYQNQLESVFLDGRCLNVMKNRNILFPQLTQLKLHLWLKSSEIEKVLEMVERTGWSLKTLIIDLELYTIISMCHREGFQKILQHYSSTLEVLSIRQVVSGNADYSGDKTFFDGVTLPYLKQLKIQNFDLQSLDFLDRFSPNLQRLTVPELGFRDANMSQFLSFG